MINVIMKTEMSIANRINYTKQNLSSLNIGDVIEIIRGGKKLLHDYEWGEYTLCDAIEVIRSRPNERQELKFRLLPAVTFNGVFSEINREHLITYSPVTALDFDHVSGNDLQNLKNRIQSNPYVFCTFVTPSGEGLKALVLHDNRDPDYHKDMYNQLLNMFSEASQDQNCCDIARRNYLSYDPDIWVNNNVIPFHYTPTNNAGSPSSFTTNAMTTKGVSGNSIISIMNNKWKTEHPEYWQEGQRAMSIFKLSCMLCKWGVDILLAKSYFAKEWNDMDEEEVLSHVEGAYKAENANFGTIPFVIHNKRKS